MKLEPKGIQASETKLKVESTLPGCQYNNGHDAGHVQSTSSVYHICRYIQSKLELPEYLITILRTSAQLPTKHV